MKKDKTTTYQTPEAELLEVNVEMGYDGSGNDPDLGSAEDDEGWPF